MKDSDVRCVWINLQKMKLNLIGNLCDIGFFPLQQTHSCPKVLCRARNGSTAARDTEKSHEMPSVYIQIHHSFQTTVCRVSYFEKIIFLTLSKLEYNVYIYFLHVKNIFTLHCSMIIIWLNLTMEAKHFFSLIEFILQLKVCYRLFC